MKFPDSDPSIIDSTESGSDDESQHEKKTEPTLTYHAPWQVYGLSWCEKPDTFTLAIGSYTEQLKNQMQIIDFNEENQQFSVVSTFEQFYPPTKIKWIPHIANTPNLLASTSDSLRLWESKDDNVELRCEMKSNPSMEHSAPLTSFDWSKQDPRIIGTSSIDTTCIIWDIETQTTTTQIIAHDKEVYDIAFFGGNNSVFGSVGADGSFRMFDLRRLEHSTIMYESANFNPIARLAWNNRDFFYVALILLDQQKVEILDIRSPSLPIATLDRHEDSVNAISWAPHSSCHICSCGDDSQVYIWDISTIPNPIEDPFLRYFSNSPINQIEWSPSNNEWIAIASDSTVQALRI
ncbi:wd repeat containing protein [Anaeramoeba ignava]|uniref:Wd repeat containing protein n=1 Tax=Anaeramoeba ignava TaxID=1746090 RepID=A0A9Q0RB35_ANAIG|nr:wd repeat containing protein [Anaeramoeba ignava]